MEKTAILLMGHGSRAEKANNELLSVAKTVQERGKHEIVEVAFLQLAEPLIAEGAKKCVDQGATKIILMPYFLYMGIHVTTDLPEIIEGLSKEYPEVQFILAKHIGTHDKMADIVNERVQEAVLSQ